jgi:nitrate reductase gamma subunit
MNHLVKCVAQINRSKFMIQLHVCWFLLQHPLRAFLQSSILLVKKSNYNLSYCQSANAHISLARLTLKSVIQQKQLRKSMTNDYLVYIDSLNNLLIATFIHNFLIPFSLTHWWSKENQAVMVGNVTSIVWKSGNIV